MQLIGAISKIDAVINSIVWGPCMILLIMCTGLYLSISMGFVQIRRFGYVLKKTVFELFTKKNTGARSGGVTPFQAVATAMASTIGTGSIAGIATAIVAGGPGSVFWMWLSAVIGMATKYAEIVLSIKFREKNKNRQWIGGPMYYIKNGLGKRFMPLATLFSIFAMMACLGIGNATQSNSIAMALKDYVPINTTATVLVITASMVILGGVKKIASVNEKLVPFMAMVYIVCSLSCIIINAEKIPSALRLIVREAFSFKAAAGGGAGYGIMASMKYGFSRGVFSNEAGLGSAPIAYASSDTKDPVTQGFWGMFEVFFTTIVICTCSALVILTTDLWHLGTYDGASLSIQSFNSVLPAIGGAGVTLSTVLFSLSSILGWAYYGEVCVGFLTKSSKTATFIYRIIYILVVYIGAVGNLNLIWSISSTMNGLMAIPNLIAVIALAPVVRKMTKEHFKKQ